MSKHRINKNMSKHRINKNMSKHRICLYGQVRICLSIE